MDSSNACKDGVDLARDYRVSEGMDAFFKIRGFLGDNACFFPGFRCFSWISGESGSVQSLGYPMTSRGNPSSARQAKRYAQNMVPVARVIATATR